jgi:hypothetical protein
VGQLKGVELANLAADALDDIVAAAERGSQRICATHWLAYAFLRHCGLSLWLDPRVGTCVTCSRAGVDFGLCRSCGR